MIPEHHFCKQCQDHLASLCWDRDDTKHWKKEELEKCKGWAVVDPNRFQLHSPDKPLSQILRLYACYAITKCNKQTRLNTTDFYQFLPLALTRASYSQTCSDTKPVAPQLRETGTSRIPAQRSKRSLENTALLDIEQISSYYKNKYKGMMLQRFTSARRHYACDTTLALC